MDKKIKCYFPGCKCNSTRSNTFEAIDNLDSSVKLPFCEYHFLIVMGGHFKVKIIEIEDKEPHYELIGPLIEVEIAEQVFASIEMIRKKK